MNRLMAHHWMGNVRELENVLVQAIVRARGKVILLEEIERILGADQDIRLRGTSTYSLPRMEQEHIENTLFQVGWNRTRAAQMLGISLPTLRNKIKKYGIVPHRSEPDMIAKIFHPERNFPATGRL